MKPPDQVPVVAMSMRVMLQCMGVVVDSADDDPGEYGGIVLAVVKC